MSNTYELNFIVIGNIWISMLPQNKTKHTALQPPLHLESMFSNFIKIGSDFFESIGNTQTHIHWLLLYEFYRRFAPSFIPPCETYNQDIYRSCYWSSCLYQFWLKSIEWFWLLENVKKLRIKPPLRDLETIRIS